MRIMLSVSSHFFRSLNRIKCKIEQPCSKNELFIHGTRCSGFKQPQKAVLESLLVSSLGELERWGQRISSLR